ncbi:MAG: ParB/RepB/Spo0J family partition protein [Anaerolineales bacterium]|jgi:ParB family chromosome partitioning protein
MTKKRGLGRGLDALIPSSFEDQIPADGVRRVAVDQILPNPRQPRAAVEAAELEQLADSIREHGVLQPLVVLPADTTGTFTLIAGERRLRAARLAGLSEVPVIVREASDRQQLEWALIENLQRLDLNPLEAAEGYRQLVEDFDLSHEAVAERVGKSRTAVTNTLRLLKLSAPVRKALGENQISEGHARALLALSSAGSQSAALQTILNQDLNVRQTEELVRRLSGERRKAAPRKASSPEETALEEQLRESLGTRVSLRRTPKGGSLVIHFYSDEELNALVERLLGDS